VPRVLLVEDEALIAITTSMSLEDAGYHVTLASDGQQGLEIAMQERPDLIVSDFMMPRMSGVQMIEKLRESGCLMPIVLATAIPENQLPKCAGYDVYLPKPYTEKQLLEVLNRFEY